MPGGDGSGPIGLGPRTGRALGYCSGYNSPGYANPNPAYGRGFGRGRGRGRGYWWRGYRNPNFIPNQFNVERYVGTSKDEEKAYLEDMISNLEEEIKMIKERLQELKNEKKED